MLSETSMTEELIRRLDEAVAIEDPKQRCHRVKDVLHDVVASGEDFIPAEFMMPATDRYARRLLHRDPQDRYTVLVMVWDCGQGTALHDHAGMWCVECVYRGRIKVVSYSKLGEQDGLYHFRPEKEEFAGVSAAGALIPPFDYHTIENCDERPSITIHVYGGEMNWCHAFVPSEGGYRRERRELTYTS